jgi:hypothetical protein
VGRVETIAQGSLVIRGGSRVITAMRSPSVTTALWEGGTPS